MILRCHRFRRLDSGTAPRCRESNDTGSAIVTNYPDMTWGHNQSFTLELDDITSKSSNSLAHAFRLIISSCQNTSNNIPNNNLLTVIIRDWRTNRPPFAVENSWFNATTRPSSPPMRMHLKEQLYLLFKVFSLLVKGGIAASHNASSRCMSGSKSSRGGLLMAWETIDNDSGLTSSLSMCSRKA